MSFKTLTKNAYLLITLVFLGCTSGPKTETAHLIDLSGGLILQGLPGVIDKQAKYLFYLHGQIVEELGIRPEHPKWGIYEYEQILDSLKHAKRVVISEARPKGTDVEEYAQKIRKQVATLLAAGVGANQINIVGASKGAIIAMRVSTLLKNKNLNFVTISACNEWVLNNYDFNLYGNILSIYEASDSRNGSCEAEYFRRSEGINQFEEIKLKTGLGHGLLYKPLRAWIGPTIEWMDQTN